MSDNAMVVLALVVDPEFECCLLDAFCEDEGLAIAKFDEIEWHSIKRGAAALITAGRADFEQPGRK